jgi:geranylgeranyl pyrophosphate synthase
VLTGDFLFSRAAKLAADADYLPLMKQFAAVLGIIVNGELTHMFTSKGLINRENYYQRIYAKTASLFEMSALSAAMIATEDETIRTAAKIYGYEIGMAFQIVDDVLDFAGEPNSVGKPVGADLLNGLVTLPAIYYAETHPEDEDVAGLKEGGWANPERMARLVESIRNSHAIHRAMDEARERVDKALKTLQQFHPSTERAALENLAQYIVERNF